MTGSISILNDCDASSSPSLAVNETEKGFANWSESGWINRVSSWTEIKATSSLVGNTEYSRISLSTSRKNLNLD